MRVKFRVRNKELLMYIIFEVYCMAEIKINFV